MGTMMGLGRVIQGRHFPSDVLWAGATIYFTGLVLCYAFFFTNRAAARRAVQSSEPASILSLEEHRRRQTKTAQTKPADTPTTHDAERRAA